MWGAAVVLKPSGGSGFRAATPILSWPDREEPVDPYKQGGFEPMETVFVKDEVLIAYEDKPEYEIHAATGSVGYEDKLVHFVNWLFWAKTQASISSTTRRSSRNLGHNLVRSPVLLIPFLRFRHCA